MEFDYLTTAQFGAKLDPPMDARRVRDFCKPEIIEGLVVITKKKYKTYFIPVGASDPRLNSENKNGRGPDKKRRKHKTKVLA